jgi:hypothetical protein
MDVVANRVAPSVKVESSGKGYFLAEEAPEYRANFNRHSFSFHHKLAGNPLFEMPRLIELARACRKHPNARPDEVYFDAGNVRIDQRWDQTTRPEFEVGEVIERIETCGAWMMIRRAELVDDYRVVLEECMREIGVLLDVDLDAVMKVKNAIVFITSPGRVTSYHIDRECNFLLQISGDKALSVFDKTDRTVLPDWELETYWAADNNAAVYKPQLQDRARVHHMVAGDGTHIPVNAPHWVKNGTRPSVSLSINFEFKGREKSDVYRANYFLRRLGLKPTPPGESALKDAAKRLVYPSVRRTYDLARSVRDRLRPPPAPKTASRPM